MDEFEEIERELREALELRPAPPGLKRKIMARRNAQPVRRGWFVRAHLGLWMKAAAVLVLATMIGGGTVWRVRQVEEQRRGEEAKQQVLTALRITTKTLNRVQAQLAAHDRGGE